MKKLFYIFLFLVSSFFSFAQQGKEVTMQDIIANPPNPAKLVNDYTPTLTEEQKQALEYKLVQLDDSTFTQIAVVIVPSLNGMDVADAAIELGRKWGVGNKKNNSGVVLLISKDDRKLNISPGYGLEGALTDAEARSIIDDIIVPNFKGDDYYRGINEGTDAIIAAVKGTYNTVREKKSGRAGSIIPFIVVIIIISLLISRGGGGKGGSFMSTRGAMPFIIGNMLGGGGSGGGWGGGGGGSSGGGGGFGGFGGGSFGGGGSSGSW